MMPMDTRKSICGHPCHSMMKRVVALLLFAVPSGGFGETALPMLLFLLGREGADLNRIFGQKGIIEGERRKV